MQLTQFEMKPKISHPTMPDQANLRHKPTLIQKNISFDKRNDNS